jgi:hypothetical protein
MYRVESRMSPCHRAICARFPAGKRSGMPCYFNDLNHILTDKMRMPIEAALRQAAGMQQGAAVPPE